MLDRALFYDSVREPLFRKALTGGQALGTDAILDEWERRGGAWWDTRFLAYVLATAYHETGSAMLPVREDGRGEGHAYGIPDPETKQVYYGRGVPQVTWKVNYAKIGKAIGMDLIHVPDTLLVPRYSAAAIIVGMMQGLFTGKSLPDYFNRHEDEPVAARAIINGQDRAPLVASYHSLFLAALRLGGAPATA